MIFLLISLVLLLPYVSLIIYYSISWKQVVTYHPETRPMEHSTSITVIVVARNEEKNIRSCITSIINQTYPEHLFELIIVDDHSTDRTAVIASSFQKINMRVIKLGEFTAHKHLNSYKKKGLETAIAVSGGSLIVTTDADCIVKPMWLETIASYYEQFSPVFIAAPVAYINPANTDSLSRRFLKIFQSLDFMMLQGITAASVSKKFHAMCNGANIAYEKKAFNIVGGFEGIDQIASGDDMLLMHKIQKIFPGKIRYLKSADAIVQTQAAETVSDFMNQRIRWASKADKYSDRKITAVLLLVYMFNAWIFFTALCAFIYFNTLYVFIILFIAKCGVEFFFLYNVAGFFRSRKLLWFFLPAQPFHILYTLIAGWLGKYGSYKWKGRKVR